MIVTCVLIHSGLQQSVAFSITWSHGPPMRTPVLLNKENGLRSLTLHPSNKASTVVYHNALSTYRICIHRALASLWRISSLPNFPQRHIRSYTGCTASNLQTAQKLPPHQNLHLSCQTARAEAQAQAALAAIAAANTSPRKPKTKRHSKTKPKSPSRRVQKS